MHDQIDIQVSLERVAVLDVNRQPTAIGVEVGRAAVVYRPANVGGNRLETVRLIELSTPDQGYLTVDGVRRGWCSVIVVHPDSIRPARKGDREEIAGQVKAAREARGPLSLAGEEKRAEIRVGSKWKERGATAPARVVEVFGVSDVFVAYEEISDTDQRGYAAVKSHPDFHQRFARVV